MSHRRTLETSLIWPPWWFPGHKVLTCHPNTHTNNRPTSTLLLNAFLHWKLPSTTGYSLIQPFCTGYWKHLSPAQSWQSYSLGSWHTPGAGSLNISVLDWVQISFVTPAYSSDKWSELLLFSQPMHTLTPYITSPSFTPTFSTDHSSCLT